MKCIWENGYSQNEMNAFEFAFPSDYKFHYPGGPPQIGNCDAGALQEYAFHS